MHRKEKKRITFAFILSLVVHGVVFIGLGLFISFKPTEDIKSMGPVFVQLESDFVKPPEEQEEEPAPENNKPQPEERKPIEPQKPAKDDQVAAQNVKPREPEEKPVLEKEDTDVPVAEVEKDPVMSRETEVSENSLHEATQVTATMAPKSTDAPKSIEAPIPTEGISEDIQNKLDALEKLLNENPDNSGDNSEKNDAVADDQDKRQAFVDESTGAEFYTQGSKIRNIIHAEPVVLPDRVYESGMSLFVRLKFDLMPDGNLINITVDKTSGYTDVDEAVITALRKYQIESSKTNEIIQGEVSFPITPK